MRYRVSPVLLFFLFLFQTACQLTVWDLFSGGNDSEDPQVESIGGNPATGSRTIYESVNLNDLCLDDSCEAPYEEWPDDWFIVTDQEPLDFSRCNYDYDPNLISTFVISKPTEGVNGLNLLFSKEDLFFLAWVSIREKINPYFLMGVVSQESAGNCALVSSTGGEGCFQITNTFGQGQLLESYPDRTGDWHWSTRIDDYPESIFLDLEDYFGEMPDSDQYRLTLDPQASEIEGVDVSSVVNFPFGSIASGLYFFWQPYLLFSSYSSAEDNAQNLFQTANGKATWQAAAYNGGAYGAATALRDSGDNFLEDMAEETQNYAGSVVDYCKEYEAGSEIFEESLNFDDVVLFIDLLSYTYPDDWVDWNALKSEVYQIFFADGTTTLSFVDDIKALVYVISTFDPALAPEWPEENSI